MEGAQSVRESVIDWGLQYLVSEGRIAHLCC